MPKLVKELPQGKAFGRSSEGGTLADTATRVWKIILNFPNEGFDLAEAIGVQIGDALDNVNQIPCVNINVKSDGESRLVRIVTAEYRSSAMVAGEGGEGLPDPMLIEPVLRPANFTTSTSLYEMPAVSWKWPDGAIWEPARNPLGDPLDGVSKLEPITTLRITQFEYASGMRHSGYVGYINEKEMSLLNFATFEPHTIMFRGVEAAPHIETFGTVTHRGFMNSYEFAYRRNYVKDIIRSSAFVAVDLAVGWDCAVILEGYNCRAFDPTQAGAEDDIFGIPLATDSGTETIKNNPYALAQGCAVDEKVRAMVKIVNPQNGKIMQNPSAMPIALNNDGRPRKINTDPNKGALVKPLLWAKQVQPEGDLVDLLKLRIG